MSTWPNLRLNVHLGRIYWAKDSVKTPALYCKFRELDKA